MENNLFDIRYNNVSVNDIKSFALIKGDINASCKDVCFARALGVNPSYLKDIEDMDKAMFRQVQMGRVKYQRVVELPRIVKAEDTDFYANCHAKWSESLENSCPVKLVEGNAGLEERLFRELNTVVQKFREITAGCSDTIEKNFIIKLLFWLDQTVSDLLKDWSGQVIYKFVFGGTIKKQEYLFGYLLSRLGVDVLILAPEREVDVNDSVLATSQKIVLGDMRKVEVPAYVVQNMMPRVQSSPVQSTMVQSAPVRQSPVQSSPVQPAPVQAGSAQSTPAQTTSHTQSSGMRPVNVRRPDRDAKTAMIQERVRAVDHSRELEYEELAMLASSVVMITVHDQQGKPIGGGSGIMISEEGYILTNNHVASRGRFYSVKIEEDDQIYTTGEIIKYNSVLDLALIRIERRLRPLPIYRGEKKLVRGQKVVAIGSPLGLFNSVSNGIISGFRLIDNVDMIQYTAPTSHGSSGGALLNMYGEVIGITTAGFDEGQNINLAVGYEFINTFISGFVK